jgi:metal-responsive CopG/Arc/MetJ family transcriptional regulator
MVDIFSKVKQEKTSISLTLDSELIKKLEEYKITKKIKSLSPMINEMLWDWLKKEEKNGS